MLEDQTTRVRGHLQMLFSLQAATGGMNDAVEWLQSHSGPHRFEEIRESLHKAKSTVADQVKAGVRDGLIGQTKKRGLYHAITQSGAGESPEPYRTVEQRKGDIWNVMQRWVNFPKPVTIVSVEFPFQQYNYPLLYSPPSLSMEVEECLRLKYPGLWNERKALIRLKRRLETEYLDSTDQINGFKQRYSLFEKRFRTRITDRHYSRLEC